RPASRTAPLLRAPRAGRSRRGRQRRLRPGGGGPWPLPPGGTVEARLPERAPSAGDAPGTRPSRAALGQRDHRADLRVAGPRAALLRLDPLARLPGGARPLSRRSRRDPRGHAGGRRGLRGGRPACARRDGAMRTWRRLPGSGKVALMLVLGLWIVAAFSPAASRAASDIRLENRLLPPSGEHLFATAA